MSIYPRTGLLSDATDNVTEFTADELILINSYIETQVIGSLLLQGQGVSARYGASSFQVTAGSGLSVVIGAGAGNLYHSTLGAVAIERVTNYTLTGLAANSTLYLFATVEDSDDNNTLKTGIPYFATNVTNVLANALLLAKVVTGASSVSSVEDRRVFATPFRYRQSWDSTTQYRFNDAVTHGGQIWYAERDNLNVTPVEGDDWTLMMGTSGTVVTSVGLALPNIFTVSGSPVTSTGVLTGALANQSANTVLAGPATGAAAPPAFRQLTPDDIDDFEAVAQSIVNAIIATPVADNTALRAVTGHQDKQIIYVESSGVSNGSFYHFDAESSATDDDDAVIQPDDITAGNGRWLRIGTGAGDADTLEAQTGSYYLNRANHTGEQAIGTVTDLQTTLDAKLAKDDNLASIGNAATARTSLGLGTMATQAASGVAITGGSVTGITDLAVADGGTGASIASGARTNLGLGDSATRNVGTSSGTVAAGDDSRIGKINGVAVTGTPTAGQVPTATGGTTAAWADQSAAIEAGGGLSKTGSTLDVNVDGSTLEINSDTLQVKDGGIGNAKVATGIDAAKIGSGTVSNTEFSYLDGVTSALQTQLDAKADASDVVTSVFGAQGDVSIHGLSAATLPNDDLEVALYDPNATSHVKMTLDNLLSGAGGGSSADGAGYLSKDISGSSNVTLTETESANLNIEFTGTPTADIYVAPTPNGAGVWRVYNNTAGIHRVNFAGFDLLRGHPQFFEYNGDSVVAVASGGDGIGSVNHQVDFYAGGYAPVGEYGTVTIRPVDGTDETFSISSSNETTIKSAIEALDSVVEADVKVYLSGAQITITMDGITGDGVIELPAINGFGGGGTLTIGADDDFATIEAAVLALYSGIDGVAVSGDGDYAP